MWNAPLGLQNTLLFQLLVLSPVSCNMLHLNKRLKSNRSNIQPNWTLIFNSNFDYNWLVKWLIDYITAKITNESAVVKHLPFPILTTFASKYSIASSPGLRVKYHGNLLLFSIAETVLLNRRKRYCRTNLKYIENVNFHKWLIRNFIL